MHLLHLGLPNETMRKTNARRLELLHDSMRCGSNLVRVRITLFHCLHSKKMSP